MDTKQKIIIFSGHDYSGKTTIARKLSKHIGIPYFKDETTLRKFREGGKFIECLNDQIYIVQFLEQTKYSVIIDRAYESEWVYSQIFDRKRDMVLLDDIDYRFSLLKTKIVICEKNLKLKGYEDEVIDGKRIGAIIKKYHEFCRWSRCENLIIDTTDEDLILQIGAIREFIND